MTDSAKSFETALETAQPAAYPVSAEFEPARTTGRQASTGVIDELLVAEVFLVQATIESVSALGEGLQDVRTALYGGGEMGEVLKRAQRGVFQPYRERFQLFRDLKRKR